MEPVSLITAALVAGAAKTAGEAVQDAYKGLKGLIKRKFANDSFAQGLLDGKPEEIKQVEGLLKNKITEVGADKDQEILTKAEELQKILESTKSADSTPQKVFNSTFTAEKQAIQQGDGSNQTVNM